MILCLQLVTISLLVSSRPQSHAFNLPLLVVKWWHLLGMYWSRHRLVSLLLLNTLTAQYRPSTRFSNGAFPGVSPLWKKIEVELAHSRNERSISNGVKVEVHFWAHGCSFSQIGLLAMLSLIRIWVRISLHELLMPGLETRFALFRLLMLLRNRCTFIFVMQKFNTVTLI